MAKRTKEAVLSLWKEDTITCFAHDEGSDPSQSVFSVQGPHWLDIPKGKKDEEYRKITLAVLGWLWQHGYKSARWSTVDEDGEGRPEWATKDVYNWGDTTLMISGGKKHAQKR